MERGAVADLVKLLPAETWRQWLLRWAGNIGLAVMFAWIVLGLVFLLVGCSSPPEPPTLSDRCDELVSETAFAGSVMPLGMRIIITTEELAEIKRIACLPNPISGVVRESCERTLALASVNRAGTRCRVRIPGGVPVDELLFCIVGHEVQLHCVEGLRHE